MPKENNNNNNNKSIIIIFSVIFGIPLVGLFFILYNSLNSEDFFNLIITIASIILIIFTFILMPKVKNFILKSGRIIMDFVTAFDLLSAIMIIIVGLWVSRENYTYHTEIKPTFWWWVLGSFLYFCSTIIKNYVLYLLISINSNLNKIADSIKLKNIDENKE